MSQLPVTKAGATALTIAKENSSWGAEGTDAADVLIPRLLLCHGQSKVVQAGKAAQGDLIRSTTSEIVGKKATGTLVIPLATMKTWVLFKQVTKGKGQVDWEYADGEPFTPENKDSPWEFEKKTADGKTELWRRDQSLNFYVLIPADVEKEAKAVQALKAGEYPDPDDALLPCMVSFRRTSYFAGRALITHFKKAEFLGAPPAASVFKLGSDLVSKDNRSYHVFTVEKARRSSAIEIQAAKKWYDILKRSTVRVDEEDAEGPVAGASAPADDSVPF